MNKQYISNDLADKTLHLKLMNMRKSIILLCNHFLSEPKAYIWYAVKTINNGNKE